MNNLYMLLCFMSGTMFGLFIGGYVCHGIIIKRLDSFIQNLDIVFGDFAVEITRAVLAKNKVPLTTKNPNKKAEMPPQYIIDKMQQMAGLSKEIVELASTLDGPLKNGLDAKYRRANAGRIKQANEEMKTIIEEILRLGYDPKVAMVDQYGNTITKKLSELMNQITKGPEELTAFSGDKPNLLFMEEEAEVSPPDHNHLT